MKDLATIEVAQEGDLQLYDPETADPLGVYFILAGPNHPARANIELERDRKMRLEIKKKGRVDLGDPEEDRRRQIEYLAAATLGWYSIDRETKERRDVIVLGGQEIAHSAQRAKEVYSDPLRLWIKRQVQDGINEGEVFIKRSSANSSATPSGTSA